MLTSICLTIWNRRDLLIYSNVLNLVPNHGTRILSVVGYYGLVLLFGQIRVFCLMSSVDWNPLPLINTYHVNIYTCVTPCILTCNYLWCLNACQWRCGLQTFFRTWLTRVSMLFNHLIDGYYYSLFICFTFIPHYYHNITQLDVKWLHLYNSYKLRTPTIFKP